MMNLLVEFFNSLVPSKVRMLRHFLFGIKTFFAQRDYAIHINYQILVFFKGNQTSFVH